MKCLNYWIFVKKAINSIRNKETKQKVLAMLHIWHATPWCLSRIGPRRAMLQLQACLSHDMTPSSDASFPKASCEWRSTQLLCYKVDWVVVNCHVLCTSFLVPVAMRLFWRHSSTQKNCRGEATATQKLSMTLNYRNVDHNMLVYYWRV